MKIVLPAMPNTLDWNTSDLTSWANYSVAMATMRGLTTISPQGRVEPGLADKWTREILSDGRERYVFSIAEGLYWSDGVTPLVAEDFVFAWRRALIGNERAEMSDLDGSAEVLRLADSAAETAQTERALKSVGVRSLSASALEVILSRPRSYFLARLANVYLFFPAPSAPLQGLDEEGRRAYFDRPRDGRPLALGRYRVEDWDRSAERIRLVANEHFRGGADRSPGRGAPVVTFLHSEVGAALYERGRLDFVFVDNPLALRGALPSDLHRQELLSTYFIALNSERPPLDRAEIRRAIAMAIDRDVLLQGLLPDVRKADVLVPAQILPRHPGGTVPYDRAAARRLLSGAFPKRKWRLVYRSGESFLPETAIAERLKSQLADVGIEVEVEARFDFSNEVARLAPDGFHASDLYLRRIGADYAHPRTFFTLFERLGNHQTGWERSHGGAPAQRFEQLMEQGDSESDFAKAAEAYWAAQAILQEEQAIVVPLFHPDRYFRVRPRLSGLGVDAFNFLTLERLREPSAEASN